MLRLNASCLQDKLLSRLKNGFSFKGMKIKPCIDVPENKSANKVFKSFKVLIAAIKNPSK